MEKKKIILVCGIPGSGKTTWINNQIKYSENKSIHISRDEIRFKYVKNKEEYFKYENKVFREFIYKINLAIKSNTYENIYIDATHINKNSRDKIINKLIVPNDYEIIVVNIIVSLDIALERNKQRSGLSLVPDNAIKNMFKNFIPTTKEENSAFKEIINILNY